jgi:hypothetical protein
MTEWTVVGVMVTLVGLIVAIVKPLLTLNGSIVRLTEEVGNILSGLEAFKKRYVENLTELKTADKKMQEKLDNHEVRIVKLEEHRKGEKV